MFNMFLKSISYSSMLSSHIQILNLHPAKYFHQGTKELLKNILLCLNNFAIILLGNKMDQGALYDVFVQRMLVAICQSTFPQSESNC